MSPHFLDWIMRGKSQCIKQIGKQHTYRVIINGLNLETQGMMLCCAGK
jgi:hypothetical protein